MITPPQWRSKIAIFLSMCQLVICSLPVICLLFRRERVRGQVCAAGSWWQCPLPAACVSCQCHGNALRPTAGITGRRVQHRFLPTVQPAYDDHRVSINLATAYVYMKKIVIPHITIFSGKLKLST